MCTAWNAYTRLRFTSKYFISLGARTNARMDRVDRLDARTNARMGRVDCLDARTNARMGTVDR